MIYSCCNENRKAAVLNATSIAALTICVPGSDYSAGDVLTVAPSGSNGTATATVTSISASGGVSSISLSQNGTGYITAVNLPTNGGHGSGCTLNVFTPNGIDYLEVVDYSDAVALGLPWQQILVVHCLNPLPLSSGVGAVAVYTAGTDYATGDVLTIAQSGSSGTASVTVTSVSTSGGVTGVALSQNGSNYSTATGVATTGGSGSGCTLNIVILLSAENVLITGGESITGISAVWAMQATAPPANWTAAQQKYFTSLPDAANVLLVQTSSAGDFSPYTLQLVNDREQAAAAEEQGTTGLTQVLVGFDPQLAEVQFSFKVECGPDFDCNPQSPPCSSSLPTPPAINYLAKDYGSFRTIALDRLNQLLPTWAGTSEADLGVVLAELIAYVADCMSYRQDAIATEAYLETARSRISLRRHALLVDYQVQDGCNARVWVCFQISGNAGQAVFLDRTVTSLCTPPPAPANLAIASGNLEAALLAGVQFFEPMHDALLYPEHNLMNFYAWGDGNCCLPQGSTEATLLGTFPNLHQGDVLIFQENIGPQTGDPADADLRHRCAVRLTQVTTQDANGNTLVDPLFDIMGNPVSISGQPPATVTEIQWSEADALPFALCISSTYVDSWGQSHSLPDVSVALGNVVLADHGLSFSGEPLGTVPAPSLYYAAQPAADRCQSQSPTPVPVRFRPRIPDSPVTQAVPLAIGPLFSTTPGAGTPVTPAVVPLGGLVSLQNAAGYVSLTLQTTNPGGWPSLFGVVVNANSTTPANIDLSVVYNPPEGAAGIKKKIAVEVFTNLSLNAADTSYAVTQINTNSKLIQVQAPAPETPSGFPAAPTMLSNTGSVNLQDSQGTTYLTVQPTNPATWPPLFGVQVQAGANSGYFDLEVVYNPSPVGIGVTLPVVTESFENLTLSSASEQINDASELVDVKGFAQVPESGLSASDLLNFEAVYAIPVITLAGTVDESVTTTWTPQQDLLESGEFDPVFVVEVESDGTATLRFGDGTNGQIPDEGTVFTANYRIGNGTAGNIGAGSLQLQSAVPGMSATNPLPAMGGTDPETNDQIRRRAPQAFLTQDRAITLADYENRTEENSQVDQAVATLRWTGSWYTVFIAAQPQGGGKLTPALQSTLQQNLQRYRLAGQDLELESPQYVSLEIVLAVLVDPSYFRSDVEQSLLAVLGSQILPNGQTGLFYPDNFTFGQTVYLSSVYAKAQPVAGVVSVMAVKFQPQGVDTTQYLDAGEINLGPLQVARLENNPNYPAHGQLTLWMRGGK
ncbi:MAG TPA: putative baseplate assembly protein [Terriglobales bacterium]|nr:putative baseplate assembly protein [Terriglobales bacterium]